MFGKGDDLTLQVMAERPETRQLTIEDCAELSRRISDCSTKRPDRRRRIGWKSARPASTGR